MNVAAKGHGAGSFDQHITSGFSSGSEGAGSATSLVKLRYKLNPRISLQFQTGTNNALDVLYSWAFD